PPGPLTPASAARSVVAFARSAGSVIRESRRPSVTPVIGEVVQRWRGSVLLRHTATRNVHRPSGAPSTSQNGWPSAHATFVSGRPSRPSERFGWTSHSREQPRGERAPGEQTPGAKSVHWGTGGVHAASKTQPPARFDQSEFTRNVSPPAAISASQPKLAQMSAFSSAVRSSYQPPAPTGGASGSVTVSATSCDASASSERPARVAGSLESSGSKKHVKPSCVHGNGSTT